MTDPPKSIHNPSAGEPNSKNPLPISKRFVGAPATAPPSSGLGVFLGAIDGGSGATAPNSSSGTSRHQAPGAVWTGMSLDGSLMGDSDPSSPECKVSSCSASGVYVVSGVAVRMEMLEYEDADAT
ncbi:unnamed protein product [Urochloa humidicola]